MYIKRALNAYHTVQENLYLNKQKELIEVVKNRLGEEAIPVNRGVDNLPTVRIGEFYFCQREYGDRDISVYVLVDQRLQYLEGVSEDELSWERLGKMLVEEGIE